VIERNKAGNSRGEDVELKTEGVGKGRMGLEGGFAWGKPTSEKGGGGRIETGELTNNLVVRKREKVRSCKRREKGRKRGEKSLKILTGRKNSEKKKGVRSSAQKRKASSSIKGPLEGGIFNGRTSRKEKRRGGAHIGWKKGI